MISSLRGKTYAGVSSVLAALDWGSPPEYILTHAIHLADAHHLPWDEFLALLECIEANDARLHDGKLSSLT